MADLEERIEIAKTTVLARTAYLHERLGKVASEWKHDGSRVTPADLAISEAIFGELAECFPEDERWSEELAEGEGPQVLRAEFAWILDPIDGTNNYAIGIPNCAISLALLRHGMPVYGVIYDMARRVLLHGGPGRGAWEGDRPTRVRERPDGRHALAGFHGPLKKEYLGQATRIVDRFKIRASGSSTLNLAYVGAGLYDAAIDHNVKVWDVAAAIPFCEGAGAEVRYLHGPLFPLRVFDLKMAAHPFFAAHPVLCAEIAELLRTA